MTRAPGTCPTGAHPRTSPGCGFVGCVDLRSWARAYRARTRLEESYKAEREPHVKGDGRWYVEIPCRYGIIYPLGGTVLCAAVSRGVAPRVMALPDVQVHQRGDREQVFRFPVDRLDAVAAILRPKRRRVLTPEARAAKARILQEARTRLSGRGQPRPQPATVAGGGA